MSFLMLIVTAVGLAADAFAVSAGRGMRWPRFAWRPALALSLTFGLFQAGMPVLGWALGSAFAHLIVTFDHWVAFGLLVAIGGKMVWESRHDEGSASSGATEDSLGELRAKPAGPATRGSVLELERPRVKPGELLLLGVATSIDALAVGVSLALLDVSVALAAVLIGVVTAALSLVGVAVGHRAGRKLSAYAELVGGIVLIAIGVKILVDHLTG